MRSGAGEAQDLAARMKASHEDMGEQLTSFACTNLAEARKLLGQRNSLEQQVKDEQVALEEQLDEYESLDDLRAEVKRLGQQAKTQVTKLKATAEELAADLDLLHDQKETQRQDLRRAETAKNKADQDVLKAEEKLKVPQAEYSKLEKQQHQVEIDRAQFTADKEGIEKRLLRWLGSRQEERRWKGGRDRGKIGTGKSQAAG